MTPVGGIQVQNVVYYFQVVLTRVTRKKLRHCLILASDSDAIASSLINVTIT